MKKEICHLRVTLTAWKIWNNEYQIIYQINSNNMFLDWATKLACKYMR